MVNSVTENSFPFPEFSPLISKHKQWSEELERISILISHGNKEEAQNDLATLLDQMNSYHPINNEAKMNQVVENVTTALSRLNSGFPNNSILSDIQDAQLILYSLHK